MSKMEQAEITWQQHLERLSEQQKKITRESIRISAVPVGAFNPIDFHVLPQKENTKEPNND